MGRHGPADLIMAVAPFIEVEGCWNVRDAGGWPGADGRAMRRGLLYRSDDPIRITAAGRSAIAALGLAGVVDLRQASQVERSAPFIDAAQTHHVPLVDQVINTDSPPPLETPADLGALYLNMYERGRNRLATIVELIAGTADAPWLVHCAAGKDRTGILVAALKVAVGVDSDDIVSEYALSDAPVRSRRRTMIDDPRPDDPDVSKSPEFLWTAPPGAMTTFLTLIAERYGSLQDWPEAMGVSAQAIANLREAWLE